MSGACAIVGLGTSDVGRVYGRTAGEFGADAATRAISDAGLMVSDIDGVLTSSGLVSSGPSIPVSLGFKDLRLSVNLHTAGATAGAAVQYACMAIEAGMAINVLYVHSDAPLQSADASSGDAYRGAGRLSPSGLAAMNHAIGLVGANPVYALAARRHMAKYGTTSEHLGAIAVSQRAWATMNPIAQMREPITLEQHQNSRWIAEPFHLLDCCLVSNGAVAIVITSAERAKYLPQPPTYIWGWGQCHPGYSMSRECEFGLRSGATASGEIAFKMAGIGLDDVGVRELYDCYTFTALLTLEDYGFVPKGEGGPFATTGALGPGGSMPTNTGGGQLSSFYLWGVTPLHEAIIQSRGHGGERQVSNHDFVLCSGNGGILDHHATLILGAHPRN